jgi:hypothetical protein
MGPTQSNRRTRAATIADAGAIAAIYNEGIADRIATFESEAACRAQLQTSLYGILESIPW